jgi:hypothetical protein
MITFLKKYWQGFKQRWQIESDWQVVIILVVFTLTGTTTMFVHHHFNEWIGLGGPGNFWLKFIVFMLLVLPLYNGLLLVYGTLLGQLTFFKFFIVKFFKSLLGFFFFWKKD